MAEAHITFKQKVYIDIWSLNTDSFNEDKLIDTAVSTSQYKREDIKDIKITIEFDHSSGYGCSCCGGSCEYDLYATVEGYIELSPEDLLAANEKIAARKEKLKISRAKRAEKKKANEAKVLAQKVKEYQTLLEEHPEILEEILKNAHSDT